MFPALVLLRLDWGSFVSAQKMCLPRLSVPCLDKTGQEGKSPKGSFERHVFLG